MLRNTVTRRDYYLFAALFYMCKFVGVLPLSRKRKNIREQFIASVEGKMLGILNLVISVLVIYFQFVVRQTMSDLLGLMVLQSFVTSAASLLISLFYRPEALANCLNSAFHVYSMPHQKFKPFSVSRFITMLTLPFLTVFYLIQPVYLRTFKFFIMLTSVNYLYAYVSAVEVIISLLCWIAKRSFIFINKSLFINYYDEFNVLSFISVKGLLEKHFLVTKFAKEISQHFGLHFLNSYLFFATKAILFFPRVKSLVGAGANIDSYLIFSVNFSYLIVRMVFLCYNCEKLYEEMGETVRILGRIRVRWMDVLTKEQAALLDTYEELLEASQVEFTACDFFPINMQQLLSVLGIIITYGLIALQQK